MDAAVEPVVLRWERLTKRQFDALDRERCVVLVTCSPLEVHMDADRSDHEAAHLQKVSATYPIEPPWDTLAALLLLAGSSQPRRRALPARPMTAHSGMSSYGF